MVVLLLENKMKSFFLFIVISLQFVISLLLFKNIFIENYPFHSFSGIFLLLIWWISLVSSFFLVKNNNKYKTITKVIFICFYLFSMFFILAALEPTIRYRKDHDIFIKL